MATASDPALLTQPFANDPEARWRAVVDRDAAFDGRFVYAVRSTGVFCRPSCPSRRPRRERVAFYPDPAAAAAAGFRACRRCRPAEAAPADPTRERVLAACRAIERRVAEGERPTLEALGAEVGLSPSHLQRVFKRTLGVSPREWAARCRSERLKAGLRRGESILESLYDAGFGSTSRVYGSADARLGMTPGRYRRGGRGLVIRHATARTPLGWLLVAATPRGVCRVALGSSARALTAELRRELPEAEIAAEDAELRGWLEELATWLAGERTWPELPVDVRGTAFQCRVWQALREIPEGSTATYAEVARRVGRATAARAVARACATNPAALAIPCHRVVPASGGEGGYRWGARRKRALLENEAGSKGKKRGKRRQEADPRGSADDAKDSAKRNRS